MKIVYLHQYFKTPREYGITRSYEIARRLVAWGHQVEMVTSDCSGSTYAGWKVDYEAGIRIHRIAVPYSNWMPYSERIRAFFRFAYGAAKKGASLKSDVVLATSTPLTIAIPGVYSSKKQKIPMVFEVRDLWPEAPIAVGALSGIVNITAAKKLEKWAYRNSSHIIALSPGIKNGIVRAGYPAERIDVIPNSCDLDLFNIPRERGDAFRRRFSWLEKRPLVVYTGALGLINGVEYLAKMAAAMLRLNEEVRFLVIGEGAQYDMVKKTAEELGVLEKNFFMMPSISKDEIPDVLSAADIATSLVIDLPEMWNNSANKFFDALASGTPVAINYRGWQAELLEKSGAGMVLDGKSPQEEAHTVLHALSNPRWMKNAGGAALQLAINCFNRETLVRDFERVLLTAVKCNKRGN